MSNQNDAALDDILGEMLLDLETDSGAAVLADFMARYPKQRHEIEQLWSDVRLVDEHLALTDDAADPLPSILLANDIGIPGHTVVRACGAGSQGVVYQAIREDDQTTVAIKVIRSASASHQARARFQREIRSLARLRHPHIVALYQSGQIRDLDYFTMEFAGSRTLADVISRNSLSTHEKLELFIQVLDGMQHAHEHGVVHRDLKPSQIFVDSSGHARVGDFGLARLLDETGLSESSKITDTGAFLGSLRYCAPEQTRNGHSTVDSRSDIYSLGILLYELLTSQHPYCTAHDPDSLLNEIRYAAPTRPTQVDAQVDPRLVTIALHAAHKLPSQRYRTASAFADDIRRYLDGQPIRASRMKPWHTMRLALSQHRWPVRLGLAAVVTLAVGLFYHAKAQKAEGYIAVQSSRQKKDENRRLDDLVDLAQEPVLVERESNSINESTDGVPNVISTVDEIKTLVAKIENPPNVPDFTTSQMEQEAIKYWYRSYAAELTKLNELVTRQPLKFGIERPSPDSWLSSTHPAGIVDANQISQHLLGAAKAQNLVANHSAAIGYLDGARSVAIGLGRGVTLQQRAVSVMQRQRLYETVLALMKHDFSNDHVDSGYFGWCESDRDLPVYGPALAIQRDRIAQWFDVATTADTPSSRPYLEFDKLPEGAKRYFEQNGAWTSEFRQLARTTSPDEALACLGRLFSEVRSWDGLAIPELSRRARELPAIVTQSSAWPLVNRLMPYPYPAFRFRVQVVATRAATLLSARLLEYYEKTDGSWPESLDQLPAPLSGGQTLDPYTGRAFRYLLTQREVVLYSINDDLIDNGATPGDWGKSGSDIVFLRLPRRPLNPRQILATKGVSAESMHP